MTCRCAHTWKAHKHYRDGTDCILCPAGFCNEFARWRLPVRMKIIFWLAKRRPESARISREARQ
jgi:hypothetical protein